MDLLTYLTDSVRFSDQTKQINRLMSKNKMSVRSGLIRQEPYVCSQHIIFIIHNKMSVRSQNIRQELHGCFQHIIFIINKSLILSCKYSSHTNVHPARMSSLSVTSSPGYMSCRIPNLRAFRLHRHRGPSFS